MLKRVGDTITNNMRSSRLATIILLSAYLAVHLHGQQLSPRDKQIVDAARSNYYNLDAHGFMSATCQVNFNFSTLPPALLKGSPSGLEVLKATRFTIYLDARKSPTVHYVFPNSATAGAQQRAAPLAKFLTSLIVGVFQTWPTKGLEGPIPPFDSEIESFNRTANGYQLILKVPNGPVRIVMDKNFLVSEIISANGQIDEQPVYVPSKDGLIYAGTTTVVNTPPNRNLNVSYKLKNASIQGLFLPAAVFLRVGTNIDVAYSLSGCSVTKGKVIEVRPPAH